MVAAGKQHETQYENDALPVSRITARARAEPRMAPPKMRRKKWKLKVRREREIDRRSRRERRER